jgi:hypothetical protein
MRTFVLLLLFTMPPLVACGAAYAKTSTEIGKPVCTHYDDTVKAAQQATVSTASANTVAATASPVVVATAPTITSVKNTSSQSKTGGTSSMMRPHDAPHWQTFLPGMFK